MIKKTKKTTKKKGNCFSKPLKKIITKDIANDKKIIPIISAKPATAWLKNPIFSIENSSVKIKSWNEKYTKKTIFNNKLKFLIFIKNNLIYNVLIRYFKQIETQEI